MAGEIVRITGLEDVQRMLREAPKHIVVTGYARALNAAAQVIARELHYRTPERNEGDRNEEEAHLIDSIVVDVQVDANGQGGRAQVGFGKEGWKANLIEYGHEMIGHLPNKKNLGRPVPANPFMRRTTDAAAEEAIQAFQDSIARTVREEYGA